MEKKKGDKGMKNLKKKLMYSIAVSTLLLGTTIGVFASWSGQINVQPPGWGGSVVSWSGVTKTSNSSKFAISGIKEPNTLDPYAQLVNSNAAAKSSWCAIRQGQTTSVNDNTGVANYIYYTRCKTNNLEPNSNIISYSFNPY